MSKRQELFAKAKELGVGVKATSTNEELEAAIKQAETPDKLEPDKAEAEPEAEDKPDKAEDTTPEEGPEDSEAPDQPVEPRLESDSDEKLPAEDDGDYLRQYQYRKQTEFGSKESDPEPGSKAETMKKHLLSQPRVRIIVQRNQGENKTILFSVCLNAYRLDFPKQVYLNLPEQVADLIMDSQEQTEAAIMRDQIDDDSTEHSAESKQKALT